jgi:hypothetical protein
MMCCVNKLRPVNTSSSNALPPSLLSNATAATAPSCNFANAVVRLELMCLLCIDDRRQRICCVCTRVRGSECGRDDDDGGRTGGDRAPASPPASHRRTRRSSRGSFGSRCVVSCSIAFFFFFFFFARFHCRFFFCVCGERVHSGGGAAVGDGLRRAACVARHATHRLPGSLSVDSSLPFRSLRHTP